MLNQRFPSKIQCTSLMSRRVSGHREHISHNILYFWWKLGSNFIAIIAANIMHNGCSYNYKKKNELAISAFERTLTERLMINCVVCVINVCTQLTENWTYMFYADSERLMFSRSFTWHCFLNNLLSEVCHCLQRGDGRSEN